MHGGLVGADHEIELHRTVTVHSRVLERMEAHGARDAKPRKVKRDADYQRHAIANHTHY